MKKTIGLLTFALILATVFTSCKKDNTTTDPNANVYQLKSVSFFADWAGGTEKREFQYDSVSKNVKMFDDYWEGALDKSITYDYSVSGKLTLKKGADVYGVYDVNAQGYITKDPDGNTFTYDANGFLSKYYEHWGDADHLKYETTVANGNITKIVTYDDDGVTVKKIKEFTYTVGANLNGLHQANPIDSDWKPVGNLYGKPSAKLVDYFEYWDPRVDPIVKSKSSFTYVFDAKNRPSVATKTLTDLSTEVWNYTYYEK
jgi:hypothetical protein